LFEKFLQKSPTEGLKIAKMLFGTQKTRRISMFLPHFSKKVFEKGLFRQFQRLALPASAGIGGKNHQTPNPPLGPLTRKCGQSPALVPVHPRKMAGHHFSRKDIMRVLRTRC
jgi:hypothetical protein